METTHVGHVITDVEGRFLDFDRRYCAILDYGRDELLSMTLRRVTHPDDMPRNAALLRRLLSDDEPFTIRKRYVRRDGSVVWVENHVSMLTGAAVDGAVRLCAASTFTWTAPHSLASTATYCQTLRREAKALCERSRQIRAGLPRPQNNGRISN